MPFLSKVTANGRVTVPAAIRRKLGIGPGSVIEWVIDGERVFVQKTGKYSFEDIHHALFATPPVPRTLEELKQGRAQYIRNKHKRG